jgi:drug/metabolite transporter (DMT)-like permease
LNRPPLAVLLAASSALSFAVMSACLKEAMRSGAGLGHALFFRAVVTAAVAGAWTVWTRISLRGLPWRVLLLRSLMGGAAMALGFFAVQNLPLGDAEVLRRTSPIFVVILAWPVLGERPGGRLIALVLTAMAGTALVVRPTFEVAWLPAAAGLLAGGLGAGVYISLRHLVRRTPATLVVLFFTTCVSLASAPFALSKDLPDAGLLLPLLGAGLAGTLGQLFMTHAYRFAPAGIVATVGYLAVAFAAVFGILLFGHRPGAGSIIGAALIAGSCVGISLLRGGEPGGRGGLDGEGGRLVLRSKDGTEPRQ